MGSRPRCGHSERVARDPRSESYPRPGSADTGTWQQQVPGRAHTVTALMLAAVATLIPLIPGIAAVVFASVGRRRGDPLGRTALVLSWIALAVGFVVTGLAQSLDEASAMWWPR